VFASFDIGSNTIRCLAGNVNQGAVEPIFYRRQVTRLGGGLTPEAGLTSEAIDRTCRAIGEMHAALAPQQPQRLRAVGTQALRQAGNADELLQRVQRETGICIDIISGDEEARLSAAGILSALTPIPATCLFFDIGGGSTEFGLMLAGRLAYFRSFPIGVVRLTEDHADARSRAAAAKHSLDLLQADLEQRQLLAAVCHPDAAMVGTAGTVTTIAALQLEMTEYDWRRVNNFQMSRNQLEVWHQRLLPLSPAEREALPGMEAGRGDLILPGVAWISAILDRFSHSRLQVSDFGLLEGVLLGLAEPPLD
jgi:exopolyphosphatase/guanosine-5'-triphosphate,3'-diphosphate pyrophosphatase